ncbi:integral membrane protein [mine drainage metagenome]|uniref:Integral membrane protein n=1 Tax=mine drainage metagenome TaxID=410659 RepID=T1BX51_9ZZZZ
MAAAVFLLIPFVVYLSVPSYNMVDPKFYGLPFFYWYQTLWLVLSGILFGLAAWLINRGE